MLNLDVRDLEAWYIQAEYEKAANNIRRYQDTMTPHLTKIKMNEKVIQMNHAVKHWRKKLDDNF